jgi:hypothetical protein
MEHLVNWIAPTIAVIVSAFLGGIGYLVKRSVDSFSEATKANVVAITDLYNKYNDLHANFNELMGEHNVRSGIKDRRTSKVDHGC